MVILVDDEDESASETEHVIASTRDTRHVGPSYTAEALPWDAEKQTAHKTGVATTIWSDAESPAPESKESVRLQSRNPILRELREPLDVPQTSTLIRPGPRIAGKVYSFTSSSDGHNTADDSRSVTNNSIESKVVNSPRSRPSSSNSNLTPLQSTMQPKVRIAGRDSVEGANPRKPPVNLPYRSSIDNVEDGNSGRPPIRKTYKSLSPYGILFQD